MFGKFFDTSAIDAFIAGLVRELGQSHPPDRLGGPGERAAKSRAQVFERIPRYAQDLATTRLNVYQKAQLGVRLQQALERAGYPQAIGKSFAYELVAHVATVASQRR